MKVKFAKLHKDAKIPTRGSEEAAGYDLYAVINDLPSVEIKPHETVKIETGLSIATPKGYFGAIFPRSGMATKQGLRPANCVGVVDSDYRGNVIVALHNDSEKVQFVQHGDRIAQLVFLPYLAVDFEEVEKLDETERGSSGFGSTGIK